jgi:hypothetical protein
MNKTIGFFGDSFCAETSNVHSMMNRYKSYIELLSKHYNADIVNVGHGGSSVWDTLLLQLKPMIDSNTVPDICVFVWTMPGRLFHRKVRRINSADTINPQLHTFNPLYYKVWNAAKHYYKYLSDPVKEDLEYLAALKLIDDFYLPMLNGKQIIHLWSSGKVMSWDRVGITPSNITYPYTWKNGSEIRPALISLSLFDHNIKILQTDRRCNHLEGNFKNQTVFNWSKLAVDNPNSFWDYSTIVDKLYDKSQATDLPAT